MKQINESRIKELFNKFSKEYDKHMINTNHVNVQEKILREFLPNIKGRVLDIATGTGVIAGYIKKNTNSEVHGIDFSFKMIEQAKKDSENITFTQGNVESLPYPDNYFDLVTCSYGFYWFKDRKKVISEIKRVLNKNGIFISLEEEFHNENPNPVFSRYDKDYLKELATLEDYIGIKKLEQEFESSGFEIIRQIKLPIEKNHDTVGIIYKVSKQS